jgi:thioredoxin-related protein
MDIGSSHLVIGQIKPIHWYTLDELHKVQVNKPKKIIIEVYSKDCEWCKKFESEVLTNPIIIKYINQNYYMVKVEAFDKVSIRFNNKELVSTNGFHPLTSEYLKDQIPLSFPTQLFFDEKFSFLNFLKGYNKADNFEMAITYFGGNYYKTTNWDTFIKGFNSRIKK